MRTFLLLIVLLVLAKAPTSLLAQITVSGTVVDGADAPVAYANVVLLAAADTSFIGGAVTDAGGRFQIESPAPGRYRLRVTSIGYGDLLGPEMDLAEDTDVGPLTLGTGAAQLTAVTVTAEKPLFERRIDRTIVNVANQPTAIGQTALEVLERSPGIIVDRSSGNINMLGKDGVRVMINGRLNYMPADALVSYLAGIPASDIVRLELITTPPADLDADGNAGYVDIVLRRLPDEGLNGNYTLTGGGSYAEASFPGAQLREIVQSSVSGTYRRGRASVFGNVSYVRNATPEQSYLRRTVGGERPQTTDLAFRRNPLRNVVNARLGADFTLSEGTTLGLLASGYADLYDMGGQQRNRFGLAATADTLLITDVREDNDWRHGQVGVLLSQKLTTAAKLDLSLDYLVYDNENPISYALDYRDLGDAGSLRDARLASDKTSPFNIFVAKADYRQSLASGTLSLGAKAVVSDFQNDVTLLRDGQRDSGFSSASTLDESIAAAYAQYASTANLGADKKLLEYQLGLRYELTDTELDEAAAGRLVDRNYGLLFPNASIGYNLTERIKLTAGYARRINRPAFTQLAPFVVFLDPRTNFGGNPGLQPGIANAFEAAITRGGLSLGLGYTSVDSAIAGFQPVYNTRLQAQVTQPLNLSGQRVWSATVGTPTKLAPWWSGRLNATLTYTENTAYVEGALLTRSLANVRIAGGQNFALPQNWSLGVSGFFSGPNVNGYVRTLAIGSLNVALQKKLASGASFTVGVDDALNTLRARSRTVIPAQDFVADFGFDFSRPTLKVTYSAPFGNKRVKSVSRDSAAEERGRVQ